MGWRRCRRAGNCFASGRMVSAAGGSCHWVFPYHPRFPDIVEWPKRDAFVFPRQTDVLGKHPMPGSHSSGDGRGMSVTNPSDCSRAPGAGTSGPGQPNPSLTELYAREVRVPPGGAERGLFFACVPPGRRWFVWLHQWLRPRLYASDRRLMHEAGLAQSRQEVRNAIDRWQHRESSTRAWARDLLGLRISSRRLMAISRAVFHAAELEASGSATRPALEDGPRVAAAG